MAASCVFLFLGLFGLLISLTLYEAPTLEGEGLQVRQGGTEALRMWFRVTWFMLTTNPTLVWLAYILLWVWYRFWLLPTLGVRKTFMHRATQTEGFGVQIPHFYKDLSSEDYAHRLVRISGELEDFTRSVQGKVRKALGHMEECTYIMEGLEEFTTRVRGEIREMTGQGKASGVKPQSRPAGAPSTSRVQEGDGGRKKQPAFELLEREVAAVKPQKAPTVQALRRSPRNHTR